MDFRARRSKLQAAMAERGVDLAFCPPSGDLEYLTGFPRRAASFGNVEYANHWVLGAFIRPQGEPLFVVPEGYAAFNLPGGIEGETLRIRNTDDAATMFANVVRGFGEISSIAVAQRTWASTIMGLLSAAPGAALADLDAILSPMRWVKSAEELDAMRISSAICDQVMHDITAEVRVGATEFEIAAKVDLFMREHGGRTPSFDTGVFAMGPFGDRDASNRGSAEPLREGLGVSFDFGTVVNGYCSDFGRTIHLGEPLAEYRLAYEVVIAAQAAGARAAVPGALMSEVHRATREVIDSAGFGEWFRHRTGHCIGLDTHEHPFVSEEDMTVIEENMTFTIEPSIFHPGVLGVRVEDIYIARAGGAVSLNDYHHDLVSV